MANTHLSKPAINSAASGVEIETPQHGFFDMAFEYLYPPYSNITDPIPNYQFDDLIDPSLIPSKNVYLKKEKLDYCVQYFKNYLTDFVQHGQTPFINQHVYNDDLPPSLQDAYCGCASYLAKTAANERLIFGIISSKLAELVSKRQYCSIEDELASVQALIMYQIIRLFDGDIRQRGIAEAQFQILDSWAMSLRQRGEFEIPLSNQSSPYRDWLFIESVRRTVLMSIFLKGIYYAIKNGFCDQVPAMQGLPLTVKGELWEAKSESDWMLATHGSQPDVITYHDFVLIWDGGDVEGFQKMLLVACIGEEGLQTRFLESLTKGVGWS